jgi:arginine exporter protein ArgO
MNQSVMSPPGFAILIMTWILPTKVLETILGDLIEEFNERALQGEKAAKQWFWQQAIHTSVIYFNQVFNSPSFIRKLNIVIPAILFVIAFTLIAWLSFADDIDGYSDGFWQSILTGQTYMALFEQEFWTSLRDYFLMIDQPGFLIDMPSMVIAILSIFLLVMLDKKLSFTPLKMAIWGYSLVLLPYLWSIIHINSNHFEVTEIGPITAIGLITFLYMILPISYLVNRKLKQENKALQINTTMDAEQGTKQDDEQ